MMIKMSRALVPILKDERCSKSREIIHSPFHLFLHLHNNTKFNNCILKISSVFSAYAGGAPHSDSKLFCTARTNYPDVKEGPLDALKKKTTPLFKAKHSIRLQLKHALPFPD